MKLLIVASLIGALVLAPLAPEPGRNIAQRNLPGWAAGGPIASAPDRWATDFASAKDLREVLSDITVELDRVVYPEGSAVRATVFPGKTGGELRNPYLLFVSPKSKDVEYVPLVPARYRGELVYQTKSALEISTFRESQTVKQYDGILTLQPGEMFYAMYFPLSKGDVLGGEKPAIIYDIGVMEDRTVLSPSSKVLPELGRSLESTQKPTSRPSEAVLLVRGGLPIEVAPDQLILYPVNERQLQRFLDATGGRVLATSSQQSSPSKKFLPSYLIRVDLSRIDARYLTQLRALLGLHADLYGSSENALKLVALAVQSVAHGYLVSLNVRLQPADVPNFPKEDLNESQTTMPAGTDRAEEHNVFKMLHVWSFMALWDFDERRIPVGIIDQGFAPNEDFRGYPNQIHECDVQTGFLSSPSFGDCGPGKATGVPTVGSSLVGDPVYHGTGVTTIAGGLLQNGFGSAGTGGQVVVPMLYKVNLNTYAFHVGAAIQLAVDQGANIINISAGYPCRMLTNIGGWAPGVCSPVDRVSFCTVVTAGLTAAAAVICASAAAANAIPIIGSIISAGLYAACGVAIAAVTTASTACYATLLLGDVRGEMEAGVEYALERGVTVVSIAGNHIDKNKLPAIIADIVDLDEAKATVENWQIIPAVIPGVIAVGAANNTCPYENIEFHGSKVATWAPEPSPYWAPNNVKVISSPLAPTSLDGTSAAAPYISGLLADIEAVNPSLNPKTPGLSPDQVRAIPAKLAALLSDTAYSAPELTAMTTMCCSPGDARCQNLDRRRNLVNPLQLIKRAAVGVIPDIEALGYDTNLNFDDAERNGNDIKAMATKIMTILGAAKGTIVTFPGTGAKNTSIDDEDWFYWEAPRAPGLYANGTVELTTPSIIPWGELLLNDDVKPPPTTTTSTGIEDTKRYKLPTLVSTADGCIYQDSHGRNVTGPPRVYFKVSGKDGAYWRDDNVYKLRIASPQRIGDVPQPDRFDTPGGNNNPSSPDNNDTQNGATFLGSGAFPWQLDASNTREVEIFIPNLNFHTCRDKDWFQVQLPDKSILDRLTSPLRCPATNMQIEFAPGTSITVYQGSSVIAQASDTSGIFLWELKDLSKPLIFVLEPTNPGEYIVYDLRIRYINGIDWQCFMNSVPRMPPRSWIDLLKDCIACEALLGSKSKLTLESSERNLLAKRLGLTDAAGYLVNWRGAGPFRLITRLTTGNLRSVKLMNLDGKFLADAHPIALADGRKTLLLQHDNLPAGKYIVLFDGYAPQSSVEVILPRNAVYDHSPVVERFLGSRERRQRP